MIKEEKNIDIYTSGRQLSEREFAKISDWIIRNKAKKTLPNKNKSSKRSTTLNKSISKTIIHK